MVWIGQFQLCPAPSPRLSPGNYGFFENKPANAPWLGQTKALPGLPASLVGILGCPVVCDSVEYQCWLFKGMAVIYRYFIRALAFVTFFAHATCQN